MENDLKELLQKCAKAQWFGRSEGQWVGEDQAGKPFKADGRLMQALIEQGYIGKSDRLPAQNAPYKAIATNWTVTSEGHTALG